ncbi:hypothetical protein A3Q56_00428 [Intoshia linei]|uniref:Major facilitator superfamily (MFS) profile domain-containing protein n=1 Tax=Intoshia linei TaxID=1819745 RepID=A0A177BBU9_9BILA|nr:hypothetical protein A3Q56_00428 [Intoshia linei]
MSEMIDNLNVALAEISSINDNNLSIRELEVMMKDIIKIAEQNDGKPEMWIYSLFFNSVSSLICFILMMFIPESPRYLMITQQNIIKAKTALEFFRKSYDVEDELYEMSNESEVLFKHSISITTIIKHRVLLIPLIISICLQFMKQMSGINMIFFYSYQLYKNSFAEKYIQYIILTTNVITTIGIIPAIFLTDKYGRRPMILYSVTGMIIAMICIYTLNTQIVINTDNIDILNRNHILSICGIVFLVIYLILFEIGLGSLSWVIVNELFLQDARSIAVSIVAFFNLIFTMMIAIIVPSILKQIHQQIFLIFIVLSILCNAIAVKYLPETRKQSFKQISKYFKKTKKTKIHCV